MAKQRLFALSMATLGGRCAALAWATTPPGRSNLPNPSPLQHLHFPLDSTKRRTECLALRVRRNASQSQDNNTVSTQSSKQGTEAAAEQDNSASASAAAAATSEEKAGETQEQQEQQQKQIGEALKELKNKSPDFWSGLVQEVALIEWPDFNKVFGTTVVVLGIIFGSSIVLLTVNFLLAELSDLVFKVQSH